MPTHSAHQSPGGGPPFLGWQLARHPVLRRRRPEPVVTVADLHSSEPGSLPGPTPSSRKAAALRPLHLALTAVTTALVAPLAHDRVELDLAPDQVGVVLSEAGELAAVWVGATARSAGPPDPWRVGARVMGLVDPVAATARRRGRISAGTMSALLLDALDEGSRRLHRARRTPGDPAWIDHFLAGTGILADSAAPTVLVGADPGPDVEITMRRACCVLSSRACDDCCPTCPAVRDPAVRHRRVALWLSTVDDQEFRSLTGRCRSSDAQADTA